LFFPFGDFLKIYSFLFFFSARARLGSKPGISGHQAHAGLVFGLSPQARPRACPPDQARPAKARARSVKPEPDPSPHFTGPLQPYWSPSHPAWNAFETSKTKLRRARFETRKT
jgi:hypothetical protein